MTDIVERLHAMIDANYGDVAADSAMSKRALAIAEYFAKHAAAIRALKSKP